MATTTDSPKRKIEKAEEFWSRKQALVTAFEAGEDAVTVAVNAAEAPDEAVVES